MADINEVITLGIGDPSTIPFFLTLGLGIASTEVHGAAGSRVISRLTRVRPMRGSYGVIT